ncbi:Jag N-terminal domain-containing protein [Clostridium sp. 'deep sea']|uniref:Jag N-terminal domain-containing protein n=1 Tax=Clostridium sp. 'deep sea' TaxID=2779445 RepID=UPI001896A42B|nr:Jag N-terminal domain-containing protein [Clostridium sp. 'deep sea']QOR34107.1 Jag N-terminal domain-containing protein [Clostridium sp. 'deep sea']
MKKSVIKSAKTVEEAVRLALKELNTTEDKVDINIIEQPSSGFLGIIGVKPAIIKVVEKDDRKSDYSLKSQINVTNKHRESKKETKKP